MDNFGIYINVGVLIVGLIAAYVVARKTGKIVDPIALAQKLVVDAERLIKPLPDETKEQHNKRKLDYVVAEMQKVLPGLNLTLIRNLIERAVDLIKHYPQPAEVPDEGQRQIDAIIASQQPTIKFTQGGHG